MTAIIVGDYAVAAIEAFVAVALLALVARYVIKHLRGPDRPADFGAMCIATGFAIGRYHVEGSPADNGLTTLVQLVAAIAAILLLRRIWRGRQSVEVD
jgi:hypothetical protein